jgi:ligand-binding sensor domain-containing protein
VTALAVTSTQLFAATLQGVTVYDLPSSRWLPPVTELDAFPPEPMIVALGDPADQSVWFGSAVGLVHYMPLIRQVEQIGVEGPVTRLVFDRGDPFRGIYFLVAGRWMFVPRGSTWARDATGLPPANRRIESRTPEEALGRDVAADGLRQRALVDDRLRQYRFTAVAEDAVRRMSYFGTNGGGVVRYEPAITRYDPMPFGLLSSDVGAIHAESGTVWVGTGPLSERSGFTRIGSGLQYVEYDEGPNATGYRFRGVRDFAEWRGALWAATDAGVLRVGDSRSLIRSGLPSPDVTSLAVTSGGLWIATSRGVALLPDEESRPESAGPVAWLGTSVASVVAVGDGVFVGGRSGLATNEGLVDADPGFGARSGVSALASRSDTVVVAFRDRITWRFGAGQWAGSRSVAELGDIIALDIDEEGVWLGGLAGLGYYQFRSESFRRVAFATDLPGPVRDIAAKDGFVWVATGRGLVRFERSALVR